MKAINVKIISTGSAFPKTRVSNDDLARSVDTSDSWIFERTGIRARRRSLENNPEETNSALAKKAALLALKKANLTADQIDAILYCTVSSDHAIPSNACLLQESLGCKKIFALDVSAACSGFLYGLSIAESFIKTEKYNHVLVVGAEVLSPLVDWSDRNTCILFGDGAGAAIIGKASSSDQSKIYSFDLHGDGSKKEYIWLPAGGSANPLTPEKLARNDHKMKMKGKEIFKEAVQILSDCAEKVLAQNGYTVKDVDWCIPHQANKRILELVCSRLHLPQEKMIFNLEEFGNTSAATVPTALDQAIESGKIKRGDLILMNVFGAGLTFGACLLRY